MGTSVYPDKMFQNGFLLFFCSVGDMHHFTHLSRMEFSTTINLSSPFPILGVGWYLFFFQILLEDSVSKRWSSWSDTALCSVWSGSALFVYVQ